jgi:hypothetical protein
MKPGGDPVGIEDLVQMVHDHKRQGDDFNSRTGKDPAFDWMITEYPCFCMYHRLPTHFVTFFLSQRAFSKCQMVKTLQKTFYYSLQRQGCINAPQVKQDTALF